MIRGDAVLRNGTGILLGVSLGACAWLANGEPQASPPAVVEIINAGLLISQSGQPELGLTLANTSARTLWVSAHFRTPGGQTDCILTKELEPQVKQMYLCPQAMVQADMEYPIHITVYADLNQTKELDSLDTSLRFDQSDVRAIEQARKP